MGIPCLAGSPPLTYLEWIKHGKRKLLTALHPSKIQGGTDHITKAERGIAKLDLAVLGLVSAWLALQAAPGN